MKKIPSLIFLPLALLALPEEGKVASGNAHFSQSDPHTLVITASDKAIINYKQFSIGENETVQFVQPKIHSTVLNRVTGGNPSEIFGHLCSNGRVFLINPDGILFGPNSQVNVGSLIASTLNIEDNDFLKEKYKFRLDPRAKNSKIVNRGALTATQEGHIVLMAPQVFNEGVISAHVGKVALLAGEAVSIDFSGDGLISFAVEGPLETAIIEHLGKISAPQGEVFLRLKTADHLVKTVVNIEGLVVGNTIEKENGIVRIVSKSQMDADHVALMGHNVEVSGDISARGTLRIEADDGNVLIGAIGSGSDIDRLSISGKEISLLGPVKARGMEFNSKSKLCVRGDVTSTLGDVIFSGPVLLEIPKVQITAGEKGDVVFLHSLNGKGEVSLSAPGGTVRFDGPVGGVLPFSSLTASGKVIDQNNSVNVTGPVTYVGEIHLGGKIKTTVNAITFNGPVIRDNIGSVDVTTAVFDRNEGRWRGANIIFTSTLDADKPDRNLSLTAADSLIIFKDAIGKRGRLGNLTLSAKNIHFKDVGSEHASGCQAFHVEVQHEIYLGGEVVHAGKQKWIADHFNVDFKGTTQIISDGQNLEFNRGTISLSEGSHLAFNTQGGGFSLISLTAPHAENVSIFAGRGDVLIGEIVGGVGALAVTGGAISIADGIKAVTIRIQANQDIVNFIDPKLVSASGDVYLNAQNGKIGAPVNPVWVETLGQIHLGSKDVAYLTGSSADGIVHSIPSNRPSWMIFNGVEYYDLVFDDLFFEDQEYISLSPDLFTNVSAGYADVGLVKPRRASLYYTHRDSKIGFLPAPAPSSFLPSASAISPADMACFEGRKSKALDLAKFPIFESRYVYQIK